MVSYMCLCHSQIVVAKAQSLEHVVVLVEQCFAVSAYCLQHLTLEREAERSCSPALRSMTSSCMWRKKTIVLFPIRHCYASFYQKIFFFLNAVSSGNLRICVRILKETLQQKSIDVFLMVEPLTHRKRYPQLELSAPLNSFHGPI